MTTLAAAVDDVLARIPPTSPPDARLSDDPETAHAWACYRDACEDRDGLAKIVRELVAAGDGLLDCIGDLSCHVEWNAAKAKAASLV